MICPKGPDNVQPGVSVVSPDCLISPGIPIFRVSVRESSTWVSDRNGPRTAMLSKEPFGPVTGHSFLAQVLSRLAETFYIMKLGIISKKLMEIPFG